MGARQNDGADVHRLAWALTERAVSSENALFLWPDPDLPASNITAMTVTQPARINVIAVVIATTAALIGRSWLQVELLQGGWQKDYAADLSYLVVPVILLVLLFPILRNQITFIVDLFQLQGLTIRLIVNAVAIGFLLRLSVWCQLVAGVSLGLYRNVDPAAIGGPSFSFNCASPHVVALGILVMVMTVPIVEEVIHRGLIQSWLSHRGPVIAITTSALLFMLAHRPSSWGFAFFAGLVLGIQFWKTKALWYSLITHATVNGLIQIDWRCFHGRWNPPASQLPVWSVAIPSILVLAIAVLLIVYLLQRKNAGVRSAPRQ